MKLILVAIVLLSLNIYSGEEAPYCNQQMQEVFQMPDLNLEQIFEQVDHCPSEQEKIDEQVKADFESYFGDKEVVNGNIKGIYLTAPSGLHRVANNLLGSKPPSAWKEAARDCESLLCAFGKLFNSQTAAMQIFNFYQRTGYLLSLDQKINSNFGEQIWSANEIQQLDAASVKLPPRLKNLRLKEIDRHKDGLRLARHKSRNIAAYANVRQELAFYETGLRGKAAGPNCYTSTSWPQEVLIHELCHHHDFKNFDKTYDIISERKGSVFGRLSGWREKVKSNGESDWTFKIDSNFVSGYATSSPAEDYAESCMSYILYPQKLKDKAPEKYDYMKKYIFKGKEYLEEPWALPPQKQYEMFGELVADESECLEKIEQCLMGVEGNSRNNSFYDDLVNGERVKSSLGGKFYYSPNYLISSQSCMKKMKKDYVNEIINKLAATDPNFCENGGSSFVKHHEKLVCKNTISQKISSLEKVGKIIFSSYTSECEKENDFTIDCIFQKAKKDNGYSLDSSAPVLLNMIKKNVPSRKEAFLKYLDAANINEEIKGCEEAKDYTIDCIEKSFAQKNSYKVDNNLLPHVALKLKVPDRKAALTKKLDELSTNIWLMSCLKDISDIKFYQTMIRYKLGYEDDKRRLINSSQYTNPVKQSCHDNMLNELKSQGYKIDDDSRVKSSWLLNGNFNEEYESFEKEVLRKIPKETKKCLISKKCKRKKIKKLLIKWQNQAPKKRKGLDDEKLIEHLRNLAQFKPGEIYY